MHKTFIITIAIAGLAVPAVAGAQTPSAQDTQNAAKHCKQLRSAAGSSAAFTSAVDALVTGKVTAKNAYGKCVSFHARDEQKERSSARSQAVSSCKAERDAAVTPEQKAAFQAKYGAKNENSAYGKCVSQAAKAKKAAADENDQENVNAARACRTERGTTEESQKAFDAKYRNFGRCVSQTARANNA